MATGEEAVDRVRDLLEEIVDSLELDAEIEVSETEDGILGELNGDDLGLFIGRRGQTIDAVQHLATRIVQRDAGDGDRVRARHAFVALLHLGAHHERGFVIGHGPSR